MANLLLTSLNGGELSPYLDARSDVDKYRSGCRKLENMVALPYGGAMRRPGTEYLGAAKFAGKRCRLIAFNFSVTTRFVLEFGDGYMRVWGNESLVPDPVTPATPYEIVSPYTEGQLRDLQFAQVNDVMYFAHDSHAPHKLTRLADDNWTLAPVAWKHPPVLDQNSSAITVASSAATGTATLTASADLFDAAHIGSQWQIEWPRTSGSIEQAITANAISTPTLDIRGSWTVTTVGTWKAVVRILRIPTAAMDANGGSGFTDYETVREFRSTSDAPRNFTAVGTEDTRAGLKLQVADYTSNTNAKVYLESTDFSSGGTFTITAVSSPTSATATVNKWLGSTITATTRWSEGAFSALRGYPRAVCFHEGRLCFGGTSAKPTTVWCSKTDDYENFETGPRDDDALSITMASSEGNRITWMFSQQRLMVGTSGDEWTLGAADSGRAFTSTNVEAKKQSNFGSKRLRAVMLNDVLLFVQRRGRKVRELTYSFEKDGWVAPDLTVLSEHITAGEVVEMAYQQQPDAILWCVRGDGQLAGMTYERDQNVVAWHRHVTDGQVESVATVYGLGTNDDEVWLSIRRVIDGQTVRYIERFRPDARIQQENDNGTLWWYADSAKRRTGAPTTTITGLGHLEGKTVAILADGAARENAVVASGTVTLDRPASTVLVGLPFTSTVQPMKIDLDLEDGSSRGRKKRVHKVSVCLFKSLGGQASTNGTEWLWLYPRDFNDPMDSPPGSTSQDVEVVVAGDYDQDGSIQIRQTQPYPLTIRALVAKFNVYGD